MGQVIEGGGEGGRPLAGQGAGQGRRAVWGQGRLGDEFILSEFFTYIKFLI